MKTGIPFTDPLQRKVNEILNGGKTPLDVAQLYAKKGCRSCGGDGFQTFLQRPGATEKEPRTARLCGCARKRIIAEARKRLYG